MRVGENILILPDDALRLRRIETLQERWANIVGVTTAAVVIWSLVFGGLVWTVLDYGYSWSPLSWLAPIGAFVASCGGVSVWCKRKLRAEKNRLRQRVDKFVIGDETLNGLKAELRILANEALECCGTQAQQRQVLAAYNAAAQELLYLDAAPTQDEETEKFKELRSELRRIGDEVAGERERKLL